MSSVNGEQLRVAARWLYVCTMFASSLLLHGTGSRLRKLDCTAGNHLRRVLKHLCHNIMAALVRRHSCWHILEQSPVPSCPVYPFPVKRNCGIASFSFAAPIAPFFEFYYIFLSRLPTSWAFSHNRPGAMWTVGTANSSQKTTKRHVLGMVGKKSFARTSCQLWRRLQLGGMQNCTCKKRNAAVDLLLTSSVTAERLHLRYRCSDESRKSEVFLLPFHVCWLRKTFPQKWENIMRNAIITFLIFLVEQRK